MRIKLSNAGRRFNREWIFRKTNLEFSKANAYAVTGPNGSGKSTFLQCLGGMLQLSEGSISFDKNAASLTADNLHAETSFCAPYLDVIEEMTLVEFLSFHNRFKPFIKGHSVSGIIGEIGLEASADKQIRFYSSGMKQRVKLAQAIFSDTAILLLDEPCSNLDSKGIDLYHSLINAYCLDRLVVVCSNDEVEYSFCREKISMTDLKPSPAR
ncbi:MAG TPA: ATP-binding cassette domain-containing protein [Flavisolibacter sp.]|nr:ATP-binding cassette domain-containing protein [Flavisolibacter sp.]